jgi:hypothetical protein
VKAFALAVALALAAPAGDVLPQPGVSSTALDPSPLVLPQDDPKLVTVPGLSAKIQARPHAYFRLINTPFMTLVCERFAELLASQPMATLHGDAHLEQYAVTDRGRGLADFDDSSTGPALLDLARFATSIRLALRERSWEGAEAMVTRFLEGYVAALRNPRIEAPQPTMARRLAAGFDRDRLACLARAEAYMRDLPDDKPPPSPALLDMVARQLADASRKPERFFHVKRFGALSIGIGSAADEKYLLRIEGPSSSASDDVILEIKEARALDTISCIRSETGPTRIVVGQSRLAYEPFQYVGALTLEQPAVAEGTQTPASPGQPVKRYFWFHAWPDNYAELDIRSSFESPAELAEVVYDVGVQLGRGHPKGVKGREADRLREALVQALQGSRVQAMSAELADACEAAWRRFTEQARGQGPPPAAVGDSGLPVLRR